MSDAERPDRLSPSHSVSRADIRALAGPATPHFALQIRTRVARLIEGLGADDPARLEGERQLDRLAELARSGERGGHAH